MCHAGCRSAAAFLGLLQLFLDAARGLRNVTVVSSAALAALYPVAAAFDARTDALGAFVADVDARGYTPGRVWFAAARFHRWIAKYPAASVEAQGTMLGSGGVIVFDDAQSMPRMIARRSKPMISACAS